MNNVCFVNIKKISVIIVTYNSSKDIFECIESLFYYNDIDKALEIIIVDNNSNDYEKMAIGLLTKYGDTIKIIRNKLNGGYGQGNNIGIREATAPVVMIMNPDVRLMQPIFSKVIKAFEKSSIVMYGMKQMCSLKKKGYSFIWVNDSPAWVRVFMTILNNKLNFYYEKRMYITGACFFIRKEAFLNIGLFDENIFMYAEEDDIHYRFKKNKAHRIIYDNKIKYLHLCENRSINLNTLEKILNSNLYLYEKKKLNKRIFIEREIDRIRLIILFDFLKEPFCKSQKRKKLKEWLKFLKIKSNRLKLS